MPYCTHGLKHYHLLKRPLYLHYALFLRALTDRTCPVSRKKITQLRRFAEKIDQPPLPESRLLQPVYIVSFIVALNTLILEILKGGKLLEGEKNLGIIILIVYFTVFLSLYLLLQVGHWVANAGKFKDRTIQRFLRWAERDIEEAQLLKTRSPYIG